MHKRNHGTARAIEIAIKVVLYSLVAAVGIVIGVCAALAALTHGITDQQGERARRKRNPAAYRRV
jgi:MFS superfamily sulfate permease-like transporter